jgi:hypothetical protein
MQFKNTRLKLLGKPFGYKIIKCLFLLCCQIGFSTCGPANPSVSSTMKKLIKETLSL